MSIYIYIYEDDNHNHSTPSPSKTDFEQPKPDLPEIDHQLMVIKKDITLDLVALGNEFDFEKNRVKEKRTEPTTPKNKRLKFWKNGKNS